MLGVLARRRGLHDAATHAARETHTFAVDIGTSVGEQLECRWVVANPHAELLKDGVGVLFDDCDALVAQHFIWRKCAREKRNRIGVARKTRRLTVGATAT